MSPVAKQARGEETRQRLIEAAFALVHERGYRGTSLDEILKRAGVTKGGLYHHFTDKHDLVMTAFEQQVRAFLEDHWFAYLRRPGDPLDNVQASIRTYIDNTDMNTLRLGCPINNLIQEMAASDEPMRLMLKGLLDEWRVEIKNALTRGLAEGYIAPGLDIDGMAALMVSTHQGVMGTMKAALTFEHAEMNYRGFVTFANSMRTNPRLGDLAQDNAGEHA
ncbi:MAG: TetR/AcrR family transcriptional regulator [Alphaproteobacteria bacterium]